MYRSQPALNPPGEAGWIMPAGTALAAARKGVSYPGIGECH